MNERSGPEQGRARRRLPRLRWVLALAAALAAAAVAFVFMAVDTVRLTGVENQVRGAFERAGLRIEFTGARLHLGTATYVMEGIDVREAEGNGEPVFTMERMEIGLAWWALLTGRRQAINSVVLRKPSRLEVVIDRDGVRPGPRAAGLWKVAQPYLDAESSAIPDATLSIADASIEFLQPQAAILPGAGTSSYRTLAVIDEVRITGSASGGRLRGRYQVGITTPDSQFVFDGEFSATRQSLVTEAKAGSADIGSLFPDRVLTSLPLTNARLALEADWSGYAWNVLAALEAETAAFGLGLPDPATDSNVHVSARGSFDPAEQEFRFSDLVIRSREAAMSGRGSLRLKEDRPFELAMAAERIGAPYQHLAARLAVPGLELAEAGREARFDLATSGTEGRTQTVRGMVALTSASLRIPGLADILGGVSGELDFEDQRIALAGFEAEYGGTTLELAGQLTGNYLAREVCDLRVEWSARAEAAALVNLLRNEQAALQVAGSQEGRLSGSGVLTQRVDLRDIRNSEPAALEGFIDIKDGVVAHPGLPAPVEQLTARLELRPDAIEFRGAKGLVSGSPFEGSGRITGDPHYWRNPRLEAELSLSLDLPAVVEGLDDEIEANLAPYAVTGKAEARLNVEADLREITSAQAEGTVRLSGVGFRVPRPEEPIFVSGLGGTLEWRGSELRLLNLSGRVLGESFSGSAKFTRSRIEASLQGRQRLERITEVLPRMRDFVTFAGPVRYDVNLTIDDEAGPSRARTTAGEIIALVAGLPDRLHAAFTEQQYKMEGSVTVGDGSETGLFRHAAMPVARTIQGRSIPRAEFTNLTGRFLIRDNKLVVPQDAPLRGSCADTPNCEAWGTLEIRQNNFPAIEFTLRTSSEAKLDTWITGWGEAMPVYQAPPGASKRFDLKGDLRFGRTTYRGQRGGDATARVEYSYIQNADRTLNFPSVRLNGIDGQGGTATAAGRIIMHPRAANGTRRDADWEAALNVREMAGRPLMACIFDRVEEFDAIVTTDMNMRGTSFNLSRASGSGTAFLHDLRFRQTPLSRQLGQASRVNLERSSFRTLDRIAFRVGGGRVITDRIDLESDGVRMTVRGSYGFDRSLDFIVQVGIFETITGALPQVPVLSDLTRGISRAADTVAGRLIMDLRVTGTTEQPRIDPVAVPAVQDLDLFGPGRPGRP